MRTDREGQNESGKSETGARVRRSDRGARGRPIIKE